MHAQGKKHSLLEEVVEPHPRDPLHHLGHEGVAHVGVEVLGARLEIQLPLALHELQDLLPGDHVVDPPSGLDQQLPLVADPRRVGGELAKGHRSTQIRQLRKVGVELVIP